MNLRRIRTYIKRLTEIEALDAKIKALKSENVDRATKCIEEMTAAGLQNLAVDGRNVHIKIRRHASKKKEVSQEQANEVLRILGAGDLVKETANASAVSAFMREVLDTEGQVPTEFTEAFNIHEQPTLGVQKRG